MVNLPSAIDFYLEKEIQKAAVMVNGFKTTVDGQGIPRRLLASNGERSSIFHYC